MMASRMSKVLPCLFLGSYRDARDMKQLKHFGISHIVSVLWNPKQEDTNKHYLCISTTEALNDDEQLTQYIAVCNDFIHEARLKRKGILVHCHYGNSQSAMLAIAYIMTVTNLSLVQAFNVVKSQRCLVNLSPNQVEQLEEYQNLRLLIERHRIRFKYPSNDFEKADKEWCDQSLQYFTLYASSNLESAKLHTKPEAIGETELTKADAKPTIKINSILDPMSSFNSSGFKTSKKSIPENLMVNVRLYRPASGSERGSQGKFVKPIDHEILEQCYGENGEEMEIE